MDYKKYKLNRVSFFAPEKKKFRIVFFLVLLIVLIFTCMIGIIKDNFTIAVKNIEIKHADIPKAFDGYRILQISDINGEYFGTYQKMILDKLDSISGQYDIVILTGDYISDPDTEDYRPILDILEYLKGKVPVYYCLGERDYKYESKDPSYTMTCFNPGERNQLMIEMEKLDAKFIYPIQKLERGGDSIFLTGTRYYDQAFTEAQFDMDKDFCICVTHAPLRYDVSNRIEEDNSVKIIDVNFDMCISGHTMGGIIRLPLLGASYSAEEGLFPQEKTTYGLHTDDAGRITNITSGLGCTSAVPFRILNTPEMCLYTLKSNQK